MRMFFRFLVALGATLLSFVPAGAADLRQMAGQMIVVGFQGEQAGDPWPRALAEMIARGEIGGVMYLKTNVVSLAAVGAMNRQFRDAAPPGLPPLIALDQEGGKVERLTAAVGFREIPSAAGVAANMSPAEAEALYLAMAAELSALGFNFNLGPVADVNVYPSNPIIGRFDRAFSGDPEVVATYAAAFVRGHRRAGVLSALKHYPGHGSSRGDSHEGFSDITDTWSAAELVPFQRLVAAGGADLVMTGHLYRSAYDPEGLAVPASLSRTAIDGELRAQLGFGGVVISDDMEMGAIREHFSRREAVVRAVEAGTDIVLFSNTAEPSLALPGEILDILVGEAERNPAFRARIEQSYARIVALKSRLASD